MGQQYIKVQDWMIALPLGKVELLIYAFVYDLTEKGKFYDGSTEYLSKLLSCSDRMARHAVEKLIDGGFIRAEKGVGRQRALTACEPPVCGNPLPEETETDCRKSGNTLPQKRKQISAETEIHCRKSGNTLPQPFYKNNTSDNTSDNTSTSARAPAPAPAREATTKNPSLSEVKAYCESAGLKAVDPAAFHAHYEALGWKTGERPIKNWKALCLRWDKEDQAKRQANAGRSYARTHEELEQVERIKARMAGYEYQEPTDELPF